MRLVVSSTVVTPAAAVAAAADGLGVLDGLLKSSCAGIAVSCLLVCWLAALTHAHQHM